MGREKTFKKEKDGDSKFPKNNTVGELSNWAKSGKAAENSSDFFKNPEIRPKLLQPKFVRRRVVAKECLQKVNSPLSLIEFEDLVRHAAAEPLAADRPSNLSVDEENTSFASIVFHLKVEDYRLTLFRTVPAHANVSIAQGIFSSLLPVFDT